MADIHIVYGQALAYLWGRQDAGQKSGFSGDFANYYVTIRQRGSATLQAVYDRWVAEGCPETTADWNLPIAG